MSVDRFGCLAGLAIENSPEKVKRRMTVFERNWQLGVVEASQKPRGGSVEPIISTAPAAQLLFPVCGRLGISRDLSLPKPISSMKRSRDAAIRNVSSPLAQTNSSHHQHHHQTSLKDHFRVTKPRHAAADKENDAAGEQEPAGGCVHAPPAPCSFTILLVACLASVVTLGHCCFAATAAI